MFSHSQWRHAVTVISLDSWCFLSSQSLFLNHKHFNKVTMVFCLSNNCYLWRVALMTLYTHGLLTLTMVAQVRVVHWSQECQCHHCCTGHSSVTGEWDDLMSITLIKRWLPSMTQCCHSGMFSYYFIDWILLTTINENIKHQWSCFPITFNDCNV